MFIVNWLNKMFHQIMLLIDGVIYWAVSQAYQIFIKLADARIFQDEFFSNFARRIYAILGVVMLFYLAYALLCALVDPDKAVQGEKGLGALAKNIVISLVLLGFLPTLFDYAYKLQGIIFKENVIGAVILGTGTVSTEEGDDITKYGNYLAYTALNPFLNPANYNVRLMQDYSWFDLKRDMIENGNFKRLTTLGDWAVEPQDLISDSDPVTIVNEDGVEEQTVLSTGEYVELDYKPGISTAVGIALLYILLSFCLDLGIRVIKFAFCQLIAPIPIIMRMMPGKKGAFDKWLKLTLTVYFEVFIRIGILYMVIYFFSEIANAEMFQYSSSGIQGLVVLVIILLGLFAFAKKAPKMLGEVLGLDSGNINLGIRDKLKAGGFFAAGAAAGTALSTIGGGTTALARNAVKRGRDFSNKWRENKELADQKFVQYRQNFENAEDLKGNVVEGAKMAGNRVKLIGGTMLGALGVGASTVAGGISGANKTLHKARKNGIKNIKDIATYAGEGASEAENARANRDYKTASAKELHPTAGNIPIIGGTVANAMESSSKVRTEVKKWYQGNSDYTLSDSEKRLKDVLTAFKTLNDKKDELVKKDPAYMQADKDSRLAKANYQVAREDFSKFNANFAQEFQRNVKSNSDSDIKSAYKSAYNIMKNNGVSRDILDELLNSQNSFIKSYKEVVRTRDVSTSAERTLRAIENDVRDRKTAAISNVDRQITEFRNRNQNYAQYIGRASDMTTYTKLDGTVISTTSVDKSKYTKILNDLNIKESSNKKNN